MMVNPLLSDYTVPPFDQIRPDHYKPAVESSFAEVTRKIADIKTKPASFENTAAPLESLFAQAEDIGIILGNAAANTYTKKLSDIKGEIDVMVSNFSKKIFQDQDLAALFLQAYAQKSQFSAGSDERTILRDLYWAFEESGAFAPKEIGRAHV